MAMAPESPQAMKEKAADDRNAECDRHSENGPRPHKYP